MTNIKKTYTKITIAIGTTLMLSAGLANTAFGGDSVVGRTKAGMCMACHGATGISAIPMYPNIGGQKEAYLLKQMKAFKSGARKDPVCGYLMRDVSDKDMADLAAFFASLR